MLLGFFTEDAYDQLLRDIPDNEDKYSSPDEWLSTYFDKDTQYALSSSVDVRNFTPFYNPGKKDDNQKTMEDLENTKRLYSAFQCLTPSQATNKYMWTYLCHAVPEYRKYIIDRWMQEARENTIRSRFFVTTNSSLLNDNALSRLWWYGYLTYDSKNENPFYLTEILLTNQTLCTDVMDTMNRMNFTRMKGVLLGIKDFINYIGSTRGLTDYFRECKKYLNHYAAVTTMEFLESDEIRDLTYTFMVHLYDEKNKTKNVVPSALIRKKTTKKSWSGRSR